VDSISTKRRKCEESLEHSASGCCVFAEGDPDQCVVQLSWIMSEYGESSSCTALEVVKKLRFAQIDHVKIKLYDHVQGWWCCRVLARVKYLHVVVLNRDDSWAMWRVGQALCGDD
jgi:hypothetical protein